MTEDYYIQVIHDAAISTNGTNIDANPLTSMVCGAGDEVVVYTIWNPMSCPAADVVFKQLVLLTSGTSCGSANVMSAHF